MNGKPVMLEAVLDSDAQSPAFPAFHLIWPDWDCRRQKIFLKLEIL
jgi:hypothetical protein